MAIIDLENLESKFQGPKCRWQEKERRRDVQALNAKISLKPEVPLMDALRPLNFR